MDELVIGRQLEDWVNAARFRGLKEESVTGDVDLTDENGLFTAGTRIQIVRAEVIRKSNRQSTVQRQRAKRGEAPKGMQPLGYTVQGDVMAERLLTTLLFGLGVGMKP